MSPIFLYIGSPKFYSTLFFSIFNSCLLYFCILTLLNFLNLSYGPLSLLFFIHVPYIFIYWPPLIFFPLSTPELTLEWLHCNGFWQTQCCWWKQYFSWGEKGCNYMVHGSCLLIDILVFIVTWSYIFDIRYKKNTFDIIMDSHLIKHLSKIPKVQS